MKTRILALGAILAALLLLCALFVSPALAIAPPPGESAAGGVSNEVQALTANSPAATASSQSSRLLATRFGVTLTLQYNSSQGSYSFDWNSFTPTKNVDTVDWVESDWYGSSEANTLHGTWPSGGEEYDVEALYFDNDDDNFYIAIVTSVPFTNTKYGGIGVYYSSADYWVRPGDLSIDLGLDTARVERYGSWHYNYGLDLVHDKRTPEQELYDSKLGNLLYRTHSDAGGSEVENPSDSDWYLSGRAHDVQAGWEHTNFDPIYSGLTALTTDTVSVAYYRYDFSDGHLENDVETWVIEATIPRSLFGTNNPGDGDHVGIRWVEGCRNDGNSSEAVIHLEGDVDARDLGDLPDGYHTTLANNGASHVLVAGGPILGFTVDKDADGQPDTTALGDDYLDGSDDEDGVIVKDDRPRPDENFTLAIAGTAGAWVDAFFDWSQDGDFDDAGEVYAFQLVTPGPGFDPNDSDTWPTYDFMVPSYYNPSQATVLYARFRVSTNGGLGPDGPADDGEVEDYKWDYAPTAVVLSSFTATGYTDGVLLKWQSATEFDTLGYHLERADAPAGPWTQLPDSFQAAQSPGGLGAAYDHLDQDVEKGLTYWYRLAVIDTSGQAAYFGPISATVPAIGDPLLPSPADQRYRVFLPIVMQSR